MSLPRLVPSHIFGLRASVGGRSIAATAFQVRRSISTSGRLAAAVASSHPSDLPSSSSGSSSSLSSHGRTPLQTRKDQNAKPQDRKSAIEDAKERKFRQYEKILKAKAAQEGVSSVEELAAKRKAERAASLASTFGLTATQQPSTETEQRDAQLAARIRERAEAEAKRKLESGELHSNPHGDKKSPIKPLSSILDLDKLKDEPPERIQELWTGYHTMKNKLSAAIPTEVYERLVINAKRYPQFVLPLPRTIVGSEEDENIAPGESKQGYEIQFMEWGFLPSPSTTTTTTTFSSDDGESPSVVPPATTVLFTPLAEYKLRQEFAQPLLVLTHYTDLARSKGLVLMRGDITSSEEVQAASTGIAAAESARARGASEEEVQRLKAPVQSRAGARTQRMSNADAQILAMTMQRFYLPVPLAPSHPAPSSPTLSNGDDINAGGGGVVQPSQANTSAREREELLRCFHEEKDSFDVRRLCEVAFTL